MACFGTVFALFLSILTSVPFGEDRSLRNDVGSVRGEENG